MWTTLYGGSAVKYLDHGPVTSNVSAVPNLFEAGYYSDPSEWTRDVSAPFDGTFAAGTLFLIELELSYWIRGNGRDGDALVNYGMQVRPYLVVEACTYQYPSTITIDTRGYL